MRTQEQMYEFLKERMITHDVRMEDEFIYCRRIYGGHHKSVRLRYLKKVPGVSVKDSNFKNGTRRFLSDELLFEELAKFAKIVRDDKEKPSSI